MTVCDFCNESLFFDENWGFGDGVKDHHVESVVWQASILHPCSICLPLLHNLREAILERLEALPNPEARRNKEGFSLGLEPFIDLGILQSVQHFLPLYTVECLENGRDAWTLVFKPNSENVQKANFETPLGWISDISLKQVNFLVYSSDDEELLPPKLSSSTGSETDGENFPQVQEWLRACKQHQHCSGLLDPVANTSIKPPTRLLDLGDAGSDEYDLNSIQLVETHGMEKYRKYATLSHCWGGQVAVQTRPYNVERFLQPNGIKLDAIFPQNFKDAIHIARCLGLRYLWIDSLCIIQDDNAIPPDFQKEAPRMHYVYGNSHLNIAAASARNSTEGLFRHRNTNSLGPSAVTVQWQQEERECRVVREAFWTGELLAAEPLYNRAWVVQERMLSSRTVHFGSRQIFWQCLEHTACETLPNGISTAIADAGEEETHWRRSLRQRRRSGRDDRVLGTRERIDLQPVWRALVRSYTSCNMTNPYDKFPAIAGLGKAMKDVCGEDWVAGLWGRGWLLAEQLAWQVEDCRNSDGKPAKRRGADPDTYRAPSWSWASVDGVIRLSERIDRETDYALEVVGSILDLAGPADPDNPDDQLFGNLKGGHLTVKGLLCDMNFIKTSSQKVNWQWNVDFAQAGGRGVCLLRPDEPLGGTKAAENDKDRAILEVPMLLLYYKNSNGLYTGKGLAVSRNKKSTKEQTLSRLGLIEFDDVGAQLWTQLLHQNADDDSDLQSYTLV